MLGKDLSMTVKKNDFVLLDTPRLVFFEFSDGHARFSHGSPSRSRNNIEMFRIV